MRINLKKVERIRNALPSSFSKISCNNNYLIPIICKLNHLVVNISNVVIYGNYIYLMKTGEKNMECYQHIGKYIGEIHRSSCIYFSKKFSRFGIGAGQYLFLLNLYNHDGITQEELTEKVRLDKATTARAIKKLEDEGYVKRIKKENDKRAYKLEITEKATQIKEEVYSIMNEWEAKIRSCLTDEESQELMNLLSKLSKNSLINKEDIYE
jgi:DNA-binding MarR family transcriptional regulator